MANADFHLRITLRHDALVIPNHRGGSGLTLRGLVSPRLALLAKCATERDLCHVFFFTTHIASKLGKELLEFARQRCVCSQHEKSSATSEMNSVTAAVVISLLESSRDDHLIYYSNLSFLL